MVLVTVKQGDAVLFLHETTVQVINGDLINTLVKLQNYRLRIARLVQVMVYTKTKLIKDTQSQIYKCSRKTLQVSEKDGQEEYITKHCTRFLLRPDPTGRRCGESPIDAADVIAKELASASALVSSDRKATASTEEFEEAINHIKASLTIAYPMGLPECEPVKWILEDSEDLTGTAASKEVFDRDGTSLWWASKELTAGKKLIDFVGKNEKTKIIVKMQRRGQGAPVREAPLDEAGQKNLMAYYFKKQEEDKRLAENEDDDYVNSTWANNKTLKSHFNGLSNVSWRPM